MNKIGLEVSEELGESTFSTVLDNGLQVFICKKKGFNKKIGLFGSRWYSTFS